MSGAKKKVNSIYHKVERKVNKAVDGSPQVNYTTRIRTIGNSQGIILNSKIMDALNLQVDTEVVVSAADGVLTIYKLEQPQVNTDLSTWDKHFKAAIKKGAKPEGDLFEGVTNTFDETEW